jgi:hypothetical protein
MRTQIGTISNYYGGLTIKEEDGKHFWSIENWNGDSYEPIPKELYDHLLKYEEDRKNALKLD